MIRSGPLIGCCSDQHVSVTTRLDLAESIMYWLIANKPDAVVLNGDMDGMPELLAGVSWPDSIPTFPVCGNWEPDIIHTGPAAPDGTNPYATFVAQYPTFFESGNPWYYRDVENVRIIAGCNNANIEGGYANCNTESDDDWAGFTKAESAQRTFLEDAVEGAGRWAALFVHRGIVAPFSGQGRSNLTVVRTGIMRTLAGLGLDICSQGDQHIRYVSQKIGTSATDATASGLWVPTNQQYGVGVQYISTSGAYATRTIAESQVPADYQYAAGESGDRVASGWLARFRGNSACMRYAEARPEWGEGDVRVVWAGTIYRNPGGSLEQ